MHDPNKNTNRRDFLSSFVKIGAGILALGWLLPRSLFAARQEKEKALATVKIAEHEDLKEVGGNVLIKGTDKGDILIVRTSEKNFAVMSNVCPHKQCKVKVKSDTQIVCPCHKSAYKLDGTYIQGPAKKSLPSFPFEVKDGIITVKAS